MDTSPPAPQPQPERIAFGRFELRPLEHRLLADGQPVALGGRAFDLLMALVQRAGRVVPRHELIDAIWPGLVVEENNLSVQVNALRKALGGDLVVTVPGRGYRFVAALQSGDAPAATAAPVAEPAPRHHLPVEQPLLIGRSEDLAALGTLVEQHRLVTVVGAGGIGKTRLAQALLQLHQGRHADGVCWVELGGVGDGATLPGVVATALGVRPPPSRGAADAAASLAQTLAGLQMLVALDNAEHLLPEVASLAETLLAAAPGLKLIVTSQAPLKLAAERVMRLAGLAIPQGPLPAAEAQAFGAIGLFVERAQAADSRYRLTDAQVPAVIELCRQLDGLALAIELAAARVPVLGIDGLLASLPERLRVLTRSRDRHAAARHQTLRATLEWSHEHLGAAEQRLFRRLAAVVGSASLTLVLAVAQGDGEAADRWAVLDALDELVQRSLVEVNVGADGGAASEPRYRLLESPRALALELLAASGEAAAVRRRHAHALQQQFDAAEHAMQAGHLGVEAWRRDGELDLENAREALACAQRDGDTALMLTLGAALLVRLPSPLHDECLRVADLVEPLIANEPDARRRCRAWSALSAALINGRPQRSRDAAARALAEVRRLPAVDAEPWLLVAALCDTVDVLGTPAEADAAQAVLDEVLALQDERWPPVRLRAAVRVQASIAAARGDATEALRLYRRLLELGQAAGDPSLGTQINIADMELSAGDAPAALASGSALVARLVRTRDESRLAYARLNLGAAWLALDQPAQARPVLQAAWPAVRRVQRQAWAIDYLALLLALERRFEAAAQLAGSADARYAADDDRRQGNETAARERAQALAQAALGAARFESLRLDGATLGDDAVAQRAFD